MLQHAIRVNQLLLIVTLVLSAKARFIGPTSYEDVSCHYFYSDNDDDVLKNASLNFNPPKNSIFFLETSCQGNLDSRQICSVESAAKHHPHWQVNVLFAGPVTAKDYSESRGLAILRDLKNVKLFRIYITDFVQDTPLHEMIMRGLLLKSRSRIIDTSDVLRFLTLYKFGGVYLDLDMVIAKPLESLGKNWVARESDNLINTAVMAISSNIPGKKLVKEVLNVNEIGDIGDIGTKHSAFYSTLSDLKTMNKAFSQSPHLSAIRQDSYVKNNYHGNMAGQIGPVTLTAVMREMCSTRELKDMSPATCNGFHVYDPKFFYSVPMEKWKFFFETGKNPFSKAYGYHVWNSVTHNIPVYENSRFAELARAHCPATYKAFVNEFFLDNVKFDETK